MTLLTGAGILTMDYLASGQLGQPGISNALRNSM